MLLCWTKIWICCVFAYNHLHYSGLFHLNIVYNSNNNQVLGLIHILPGLNVKLTGDIQKISLLFLYKKAKTKQKIKNPSVTEFKMFLCLCVNHMSDHSSVTANSAFCHLLQCFLLFNFILFYLFSVNIFFI